jgi:hypothetical protein
VKKTYKVGGQEFTGEEVDFEVEREGWNVYILHDGTTMKMKSVVASIVRLDGAYSPNGDPLYIVNASSVVSTDAPDHLKRKD